MQLKVLRLLIMGISCFHASISLLPMLPSLPSLCLRVVKCLLKSFLLLELKLHSLQKYLGFFWVFFASIIIYIIETKNYPISFFIKLFNFYKKHKYFNKFEFIYYLFGNGYFNAS